ncbi:MAG: hypothetical protein LBR75_05225, partial [Prevotellaceae bacterium]|nr:hypothetical protein [Prevotellaceae bacterium]
MKKIVLFLLSGVSLWLYAAPEEVNLFNAGKMYIETPVTGSTVSLRVEDAVKFVSESNVTLKGVFKIGGNFVQDSEAHVFPIGSDGYTTSTGTMIFGLEQGADRSITTSNFANFDRGTQYIAFPQIEIETDDTIVLPAQMGIDALTVKRNSGTGVLLLKSDSIIPSTGGRGPVYDASLRITTTTTGGKNSGNLVTKGAVIAEQYMRAYRHGEQLLPFASPYIGTQLSGYFAGN